MSENKKYYWLKLKRDFFKRHDIRIIEEMPNGKDYVLFYLKMLLESIDHEGSLRFSDTIPYNEQMLSVVTNTNVDIVRSAMKMFIDLKMIDLMDDKTIYMTEVDKLIGSETGWAEKKRLQRAKKDNVPQLSEKCPTEIEKDIEKDKDIEIEQESVYTEDGTQADEPPNRKQLNVIGGTIGRNVLKLTDEQIDELLEKLGLEGFNTYCERLANYIIDNNANIRSHYKTILKWYKEDQGE